MQFVNPLQTDCTSAIEKGIHGPFAKLGSSTSPSSQIEKIRGGQANFFKVPKSQTPNQILGLIRYTKSAHFLGVPVRKSQIFFNLSANVNL